MAERKNQMVINYVPGEECRVAIVENGNLEELHVERFASASRVGNIYVGKVMNVEAAIQAAFVDFGVGENGFLHISDLHPKYFPGEDDGTTERVGFKTPRRERPSIQQALRRGDEVIVQVLKEGVGTKGPTLTSYLSIPGRFLVMMPGMDNVGVSRKVEDEDQRRKMREILDQLDLPEGFGFILRTAGMARTKAELKRDLAYLMRLWKDMEKRNRGGSKPRLLYSESDLLVRSLRDLMTNEVDEVVIDHEIALRRASRFMKIVAPRGTAQLLQYAGRTPIFHAFGIEQQVQTIHAREVALPSGGRLVIDQTEALVAIDVNSGKSRDSRNSEENAYQTNIEAVDEICRQLRLRDMGGIVVNDLIDMRRAENRKDIESRFRERLKRDRARTTVGTISEFGILEMTRQRMRPSHESVHFAECPTCRGRGLVQKPESVAADALRELSALLDVPKVGKAEIVVGARVAGELLSHKRRLLNRIERSYEKHVDVRVSEAHAQDRVSFYAYDESGADLAMESLPRPRVPKDSLVVWEQPAQAEDAEGIEDEAALARQLDTEPEPERVEEEDLHPIEIDEGDLGPEDEGDGRGDAGDKQGGRRRRRGRRGRGREDGRADAPREGGAREGGPREGAAREGGPREGRGQGGRAQPDRGRPPERVEAARSAAPVEAGPKDGADAPDGPEMDRGAQGAPGQNGQGGPGGPGESSEDGQRRRRRRRRRGRRGRGVNGEALAGEGAQEGGPEDGAAPEAREQPRDQAREPGREPGRNQGRDQSRAPSPRDQGRDQGRGPARPVRPPVPTVRDGIIFGDHGDEDEVSSSLPASAEDLPPPELDPNAPDGDRDGAAPRTMGEAPAGDVLPVSRGADEEEEDGAPEGPEGLDGAGGDTAAGGKRRRRRRRRGGRGRGRGEGQVGENQSGEGQLSEGPAGDGSAEGPVGDARGADGADRADRAGESPERDGTADVVKPVAEASEPVRQPTLARGKPRAAEGETDVASDEPREGAQEERRGGRSRRRGRGGRGPDKGEARGPAREGPARDARPRESQPSRESRAPRESQSRGNPPRENQAREAAARAPERATRESAPKVEKPAPAATPKAPEAKAPKPRTLYGNIKRKLNPSELNKRPKPE